MNQKNQLSHIFYLLVLVIAFLLTVNQLFDFFPEDTSLKKPDLFSDVHPDKIKPITSDSQSTTVDTLKPIVAPHAKGFTSIEEFGQFNLRYFFEALRYSRHKPVRIAFFGDSFIEGDILCGPFRDSLQQLFGGSGVGYMPITSEVTKFRTSIQHDFAHWETFSMISPPKIYSPLGLPGFCFKPMENNEVQYGSVKRNFVVAKFFYESENPFTLKGIVNDTITCQAEHGPSHGLNQFIFPVHNIHSIRIYFPKHDSLRLYGTAFEDSVGVGVDNFAMRSNPGMGLLQIDEKRIWKFDSLRNYKLVILQYGLNVLSEKDTTGYLWYLDKMTVLIKKLKNNFPECGFLLVGVGDRSSNQNGRLATMPHIFLMRGIQRKIAEKSGIAYWDMFEAMGGENSMIRYTESQPPLAAKDFTHLTFRGGRKIAKKLTDALLKEKAAYGEKK